MVHKVKCLFCKVNDIPKNRRKFCSDRCIARYSYYKHRDKRLLEMRAYYKKQYKKDKEKILKKHRDWRKQNKEKLKVRYRMKYQKNKDKINLKHREKRKNDPIYNERVLDDKRSRAFKKRIKVIVLLGNKCNRCGFDEDIRALQIDHVNEDGSKHRKQFSYYSKCLDDILKRVKEGSKDFQVLCANCNIIKRYENNKYYKLKELTKKGL